MKYLKMFENFETEIVYEDIEDMLIDYIDSGDIYMKYLGSTDNDWFFNLVRPNMTTFLMTYVTCLIDEDDFMEDPFESITLDTDTDEYFKVEKSTQNKDSKSIYFKIDISKKLALKFFNISDSETKIAFWVTKNIYRDIVIKRFIFKILKSIFSKFLLFYKNTKIFYRVYATYDLMSSESRTFANIVFRVELPES